MEDTPPISPRTIPEPPRTPPAARPPCGAPAFTEISVDRPKGPEPPERSEVRYQFDHDGCSNALNSAWEIFMFGGAIWRISPLVGPLPFPGDPYGLAIQVVEMKYVENFSEENDDDDSTNVYAPLPMSYINDLFSAKYWSDIQEGVKNFTAFELIGNSGARPVGMKQRNRLIHTYDFQYDILCTLTSPNSSEEGRISDTKRKLSVLRILRQCPRTRPHKGPPTHEA